MRQRYTWQKDAQGHGSWQLERPFVLELHVTDCRGVCLPGCQACAVARFLQVTFAEPEDER